MGSWREKRVGLLVALLALVAATPTLLGVIGVRNTWALGGATALAAIAAGLAVMWQDRYKRIAQHRDELSIKIEESCLVLPSGRLPKVREVADPLALGTHPSEAAGVDNASGRYARVPPYVERDVDAALRQHLTRSGFVLLVGDSTAGKSRAGYEAMAANLPDHVLVVPAHREALAAAINVATEMKRCVLWLDDLERFLGAVGLTRNHVARFLSDSNHHRLILATLRGAEERRFTETSSNEDDTLTPVTNLARETLAQVTYRLRLDRRFSLAEQDRAQALASDPRIAEALQHANEYGIGEYLACGPEVQRDLENAWEIGTNPRGAALVAAAIDTKRSGYVDPPPRALLERLHEVYLQQRGGDRLRPETLDEAWAWATRPRRATVALLQLTTDGNAVAVFDYLVDEVQRRAPELPSDQIVTTVLDYADSLSADNIGNLAYVRGAYSLAKLAYQRAYEQRRTDDGEEHQATLASRGNRASMLWELGSWVESEAEHRAVLGIQRRVLGEEHPDTLTSRFHHALVVWDMGRLAEAEAELRAALEIRRRLLGDEHPDTLIIRGGRAFLLRELGKFTESEAEHRAVLKIQRQVLGEDHPDTLINRDGLALALWESKRLTDAEAEERAVLEMRRRVLGNEHPDTLISRNNLALILRDLGRFSEAQVEHRAVLGVRQHVFGEDHPATLLSRDNLALILRDLGHVNEAETEHRAVLTMRARILGPEHPDTLTSRDNRAVALQELGLLEEAAAEHRAVLVIRRRVLGETHPYTTISRDNLAIALAKHGHSAETETQS